MSRLLPPLRLVGATILRDGALQARSIAIEDGRITRGPLPEIDLTGYLVLPGMVDLHGSSFTRHLAPRPAAQFDPMTALAATDREAAANGVTTAYLSQGWSWQGGLRGPDFAETLMSALRRYRAQALTDLRMSLECETHMVDTAARLMAAVRSYDVGRLVFHNTLDDTLEHLRERQMHGGDPLSVDEGSAQEYRLRLRRAQERSKEVPRHLCRLAEAFDDMGVIYGSNGDLDGETRESYAMIGAKQCEFPRSRRAAAAAKAMGDPVILSAPDTTHPKGQFSALSTIDLIKENTCDALASDYYYPSMLHAVWMLVDMHGMSLPAAWSLVSERPAQIMRLPDRGTLTQGRRADLVILHEQTRRIEATIVGGRLAYMAGEAGARFLGHTPEETAFAVRPSRSQASLPQIQRN
ncbi:alpha-D-ribose 1-methylphosphonate 5-triphosphate diphosphatase [Donghicola sp. C2-DW-16]|uniref:Alpha-D-ribose 1-methylphosphonate 5-triphosphate diphosphatase n=1 Tax=Donghicola mangrovi TaxID=2729614 RepID=A0ABX2PHD9_9RHOB|nr:alpha-D-ribose 1-methylphosphonate 5-triphosphate diphosphatase [Donghicola mangrovi]NVO28531.1 alpha-D-ribose 1-methylphosphonate 5-triphosphate diphosphatase [Donghicola mangrovi]